MRSCNLVHPLPKGLFLYISITTITKFPGTSLSPMETGLNRQDIFSFGTMPSLNIPDLAKARQDLPLPDSRIGAFEPSLYGTIIHTALTLNTLNRICNLKKDKNY